MSILHKPRRPVWSADELVTLEREIAAGRRIAEIAVMLGRSVPSVFDKSKGLRSAQRVKEPEPLRTNRWVCQNCGTRSDAALDFGCRACRPMRSLAA